MADRFQYPIQAANDPESLSAVLRDEIQWFRSFDIPTRRKLKEAAPPAFFLDGQMLGDDPVPEVVTLDEFQPFSQPVFVRHQTRPGWSATDPQALGDALDDKIGWFTPLSEPVLPEHLFQRAEAAPIDPATLDAALRDEIQWFQELSIPVLPRHLIRTGTSIIDSETLGDPLRDELQWFQELSEPTRRKGSVANIPSFFIDGEILAGEAVEIVTLDEHRPLSEPIFVRPRQQPDAFTTDPATLDAAQRDELQWFRALDGPMYPVARAIEAGNIFVDEIAAAPEADVPLDWFQGLSLPIWQIAQFSGLAYSTGAALLADEAAAEVPGTRRQRQMKSLVHSKRRRKRC